MNEFLTVLGAVVPVFAIIGAGFALRKLEWLTEEADQSLLRLTINVLFPCLILDHSLGNPALTRWSNLALAPLVGFGTVVTGMWAARWLAPVAGLREPAARNTFGFGVGLYNYGFVPIPLALLLFDTETLGVLFVHNVGVEAAIWTVGLVVLTGARGGVGWKKMLNAPLFAIVLALLLNFSGLQAVVPGVARTTLHLLAECAIPVSLLLVGATVADHAGEFHAGLGWRVMGVAVGLRLGILPLVFLVVARYLPGSVELKRVMILEAAMASAVFPIVMSKHYGGDPATALRVIVGTSLLSLLTTPVWVRLGLKLVLGGP